MKTFEFTYNDKNYKMRELDWQEDLSLQEQCMNNGVLQWKEWMILRVAKSLVEPKLLTDDVRHLSTKEGNFLNLMWLKINDVDQASFLGISLKEISPQ